MISEMKKISVKVAAEKKNRVPETVEYRSKCYCVTESFPDRVMLISNVCIATM